MRSEARAPVAPTTSQPAESNSKAVWIERKETAREAATALRWGLGIVLLVLMAFKKLDVDQLRSLGKTVRGWGMTAMVECARWLRLTRGSRASWAFLWFGIGVWIVVLTGGA